MMPCSPKQLQAVQSRQAQVGEHQIELLALQHHQGSLAIILFSELISFIFKDRCNQRTETWIIPTSVLPAMRR